ncbi:MAG: CNNM domain-containing protein [Candidatus Omnitrophica bacterium]|nr:CNNM domain-containing protein [Candidatus Omnitrophota bacterium]MDD5441759.1 CNNM domain-containing protein [Candidatus Omnitrophota bacterium]
MIYFYLLGCLFFIITHAFFAASEISYVSSNIIRLRHKEKRGDKNAALAYKLLSRPERFLATTLVGTNISVVISTAFLTFIIMKLKISNESLVTTLIFTPFVVIFGELIPKNFGRFYKERFSCYTAKISKFFEILFLPVVIFIECLTKFIVKTFMGKAKFRSPFVTKEEIKSLVREIAKDGGIDRGETEAIEEVFEFKQDRVKDIAAPLKKVVGIDYTDSSQRIMIALREGGFTRYPVFKNKEIVGYINIYDVFYHETLQWQDLVRPITKVGINQKAQEIFTLLKKKKESMALVFKGKKAFGIVTIQDLMREITESIVK